MSAARPAPSGNVPDGVGELPSFGWPYRPRVRVDGIRVRRRLNVLPRAIRCQGTRPARFGDLLECEHRGPGRRRSTARTRRADMLAELKERDATGKVAAIYEEIRRFWAVPYVSS